MKKDNEIYRRNIELQSRPHIPLTLRPELTEEQKQFEAELTKGIKHTYQGVNGEILFRMEKDPTKCKKRIFIYDTSKKTKTNEDTRIGFVGLAGYSHLSQYEVDLSFGVMPSYRGKGVLEDAVENYQKHLHNNGVVVVNIGEDKFTQRQF